MRMSEPKKPNVNAATIAEFLEKTGFVFEMRANEVFLKMGYSTEINAEFLDLEKDVSREIDIIATKVINEINIHFVVECKQSLTDKWIFICNKKMPRFYYAVKHLPSVELDTLKERKLFAGFHQFVRKLPLSHNYLAYTIANGKKAEHLALDECVHKLPKAVVDLASSAEGGRHLFFPVVLFAGQMFAVSYKGKLVVDEVSLVEHYVAFDKEVYRREPEHKGTLMGSLIPAIGALEKMVMEGRQTRIRGASIALGPSYQLDFVTEPALPDYLNMIEKQVSGVQVNDWPLPQSPAPPAPLPEFGVAFEPKKSG